MFAIDKIGVLKSQIKVLEIEIEKLQLKLITNMKENNEMEVLGKTYKGTLIPTTTLQVDGEALLQVIGQERFLKVVKPSVKEVRIELSSVELEACSVEVPGQDRFCVKLK